MTSTQAVATDLFHAAEREERVRRKAAGSLARYQRSAQSLAGGVSSGLRRSQRPFPLFFESGQGSRVRDVDGNTYLDYGLAWGPLILGHAPAAINEAVAAQLTRGHTYGAQHDLEIEVAELLTSAIPCAGLVAFANSGTEIVQVALRLARAATGRTKYLKFEGPYHGWDDSVLVSYHPTPEELARFGDAPIPVGAGQRPESYALVAQWNDQAAVEALFAGHGSEISCVICEPMMCNSGCIPPRPGFLEFLREITRQNGSLLIFDEVITGFRLSLGGAQQHYGVTPDLATFAKAIAGGLPLSAMAGAKEFMELIASGRVVHAGTMNGNPLVLVAAKATLQTLAADGGAVYQRMWRLGLALRTGIEEALRRKGLPVRTTGGGPVFQVHFQENEPWTYRDTLAHDRKLYSDFVVALLDEGVLVLPDGRFYISAAHTEQDVEETLAIVRRM
jgi:glutamate-1-semialdehyde 2,1-aminomutase